MPAHGVDSAMVQMIEANALAFGLALVVVVLLAIWLLRRAMRRPQGRAHTPDVLDEGVAPAARNQALIDAPPAAAVAAPAPAPAPAMVIPSPAGAMLGGVAEAVALGAEDLATPDDETGDDLTRIKGLGPKLATMLALLGVNRFAQIAEWDDAELARIDAQLGSFAGRPARDAWVEQAQLLAAGDTAAYAEKFGNL